MGQRDQDCDADGGRAASTMNTTRLVFTAAAMPADQARAIVGLICMSSPERATEQRRNRIERHFTNAVQRVLKFAKHETLRKLHRYKYSHRPLMGQEEQVDHPDSLKVAFNVDELRNDLLTMLETEAGSALATASQDTLDAVGYRDPWKLPAQDTLDFIAHRQNLLSNVPQEIFDTIRNEISAGLNAGESIRDLSKRISNAFDEIGKTRAQLIAQTETAAAYSFASDKAARQAGIQYKKWVHSVIPKVPRPDHLAIDGLIVPMDEPYPVGDPPLMYPHASDGAPEDVINCRCMSIPVTEADYQAQKK
jgi:SPP1 gp7 family putative phage head morphogenesis protein